MAKVPSRAIRSRVHFGAATKQGADAVNPADIPPLKPPTMSLIGDPGFDSAAMHALATWLDAELGANSLDAERLFEHLRASRDGVAESFLVSDGLRLALGSGPRWTVRVDGGRAIVHNAPGIQEPCMLTVDELISVVLRWFDAIRPDVGTRLRAILDGPVAPVRAKRAATAILSAVLAVVDLSGAAIEKALGIPLQMESTSDPMRYYKGHFVAGPFQTADFRFNAETGGAILILAARNFSLSDVDFD